MKYNSKKKLVIEMTMDSSEAIMFKEGGKHTLLLRTMNAPMNYTDDDDERIGTDGVDEIEISVQMADKSRFDFVNSEAKRHREMIQAEENLKTFYEKCTHIPKAEFIGSEDYQKSKERMMNYTCGIKPQTSEEPQSFPSEQDASPQNHPSSCQSEP